MVDCGVKNYLLSAQNEGSLLELVEFYQLDMFFEQVRGTNNFHGRGKGVVAGEILENIRPLDSVLFIGDTYHDYEVAQALGIDCILLSHGHTCHSRLIKTGATVIRELKTLFHIFAIEISHAEVGLS